MKVQLSLSNLAAVKAASEDEDRASLFGLAVSPKGTVATDGYMLCRVEAMQADESEMRYVLIRKDYADAALSAVKKTAGRCCLVEVIGSADGEEEVEVAAFPSIVRCKVFEKVLPNYDSVLPRDKPQVAFLISYGRLLKLLKLLNEMKPEFDVEQPVLVAYYGQNRAIRLTTENRHKQRVDILVMPMIGEIKEWLDVPPWTENGQRSLLAQDQGSAENKEQPSAEATAETEASIEDAEQSSAEAAVVEG